MHKITKLILTLFVSELLFISSATMKTYGQQYFRGWNAVEYTEFIYRSEDVSFPSCHASTIAETENGLVTAWFGGTAEKNPDVSIWVSRQENGVWTTPAEAANGKQNRKKRFPAWNPVLFRTGEKLTLFYKVGPSPREWWGEVIYSLDNGISWSKPKRLPEDILGPIKDKPVWLKNGWILSPSSTENHGWQVHIEISKDTGITWTSTGPLNDPEKAGLIQPTILIHTNGRIQMLCRSKNGRIFTSWSDDNGLSWSGFHATALPNPNSGIDAVTLTNGTHLLVYNHIAPEKGKSWGDRNILNVAVSDDGVHWKAAVLLENDPDRDAEYSYPAVIQTKDGMVHITYTWNRKLIRHVVLDPEKIRTREFDNNHWPLR